MCCGERPGPWPRALLHAALECIAPFGDADDRAGLTRGDKFGHISPDASPSGPLARQRSSQPTQQHTRPHRCEVRRRIQRARTGFEARGLVQTNFAHNFSRSLFETTRKRCNPNDTTSISKQVAGELRAKLLRRWQDPSQTNFACNSIGTNFNKPRKRCNSNDLISGFERVVGELHAKLGSSTAMCARTEAGPTGGVGTCCGAGRRWRGMAGLQANAPSHISATRRHCVEGAGGTGGHGRASRRGTERSEVLASRAAEPSGAQNTRGAPSNTTTRVRQRGGYRSTRPLSAHSATTSSRLRPNDRQSWRRRRIHRNMPPTTAAPRPAPPIRPSKPVRARPFFGLVAGTSGAT